MLSTTQQRLCTTYLHASSGAILAPQRDAQHQRLHLGELPSTTSRCGERVSGRYTPYRMKAKRRDIGFFTVRKRAGLKRAFTLVLLWFCEDLREHVAPNCPSKYIIGDRKCSKKCFDPSVSSEPLVAQTIQGRCEEHERSRNTVRLHCGH